jgi:hypothetical protein
MIDKQAILSRQRVVERECAELGGSVRVRRMRIEDLVAIERANGVDGQCELVASCVMDAADQPLFTAAEIKALDAPAYLALSNLVGQVNGLGEDSIEKKPSGSSEL